MLVLYVNHFIISETLYALDIYHIEMDTSFIEILFLVNDSCRSHTCRYRRMVIGV